MSDAPTRPIVLLPGLGSPEPEPLPGLVDDARRPRNQATALDQRVRPLSAALLDDHFPALLRELKQASGVGSRTLAARCGVQRKSLEQYFRQHDPKAQGGRCAVRWFVRFVAACGGEIVVLFPDARRTDRIRASQV